MTKLTRSGLIILVLSCACNGCSDAHSPIAASPAVSTSPSTPVALSPAPTLTAITPKTASVDGSAWGTISGAEFARGARVTFGDVPVTSSVQDSATVLFWLPPHAAGTVDVVVTNPNGQPATLAQAFTFASAAAFDLDGTWVAHAGDEYDTAMRIVIEGGMLKSVVCGTETIAFIGPAVILAGEFAAVGSRGERISGRIVSPLNAVGTITVAPCANGWWAEKQ